MRKRRTLYASRGFRPAHVGHLRDRGVRWSSGSGLLIALAALALSFPASLRAERMSDAVGLEAQGIDPWQALHNFQGLDVRDELGRPVSAVLIESQLKSRSAAQASESAWSSSLPEARAALLVLEFWSGLFTALSSSGRRDPFSGLDRCPALPLRRGEALAMPAASPSPLPAEPSSALAAGLSDSSRSLQAVLPLVLRC